MLLIAVQQRLIWTARAIIHTRVCNSSRRTVQCPASCTPNRRSMSSLPAATTGEATEPSITNTTISSSSSSSPCPRVLSIQSSVVHGYVGNKAAVFPLQLLGFDVDPVNTVQFSNHTGYPTIKGHVFDGGHLRELLAGLTANGLICHTHLLSGYIGSQSLLEAVAAVATELRKAYPQLTYVCDPVLGDEGKLYVSEDLVAAYRATLVPLANILTPNQFEAELLTSLDVKSEAQALQAAAALHTMGPHTVIITSLTSLESETGIRKPAAAEAAAAVDSSAQQQQEQQQQQQQHSQRYITLFASTRVPQAAGCPSTFRMRIPKLQGYFTGTGDLLTALLLAWSHRFPDNLAAAVEHAVAGLQAVLQLTADAAGPEVLASADDRAASVFKAKELRLVQGQQLLLHPVVKIKAEPIEQ